MAGNPWQRLALAGQAGTRQKRDWLGREGSNLRMAESKSAALPLGYAPTRDGRRTGRKAWPSAPPIAASPVTGNGGNAGKRRLVACHRGLRRYKTPPPRHGV